MKTSFVLRKPSAILPLLMSAAALVVVIVHLVTQGVAREADEGAAAHLFQLLIGAQVPVVLYFLFRWLPKQPKSVLSTFAIQVAAASIAMAPVAFFHL